MMINPMTLDPISLVQYHLYLNEFIRREGKKDVSRNEQSNDELQSVYELSKHNK